MGREGEGMNIGDVYSRKVFEFTVVGKIKHKDDSCYVYTIMQRQCGTDLVSYFVNYGEFGAGFEFQRNDAGEEV